jgi:hypothetical protein
MNIYVLQILQNEAAAKRGWLRLRPCFRGAIQISILFFVPQMRLERITYTLGEIRSGFFGVGSCSL